MISHLRGKLIQKFPSQVVLDIGGVGYQAWIPLSTYLKLGNVDETVSLFIHTHMTDSSLGLYGFSSEEEREIFLKLIGISGIGPKIALNILSGIEVSDLEEAIHHSDVGRLALIPGIGKKTAMRIAMELQEKLEKKIPILKGQFFQEKEDLISALTNMGFKRKEVERIVEKTIEKFSPDAEFETLLRESLKQMAKL